MKDVVVNGVYRHFKGNIIKVISLATNTENLEPMVVYKHINDDNKWVRPKNMFLSKVDKNKYPNTEQEYRFELVK